MRHGKYYPFKLKLESPVIITTPGGDPNSANCAPYISGSAIRGAAADALVKAKINSNLFNEIINSGKVCFLNCYPCKDNKRSLPVPISYQMEKTIQKANSIDVFDLLFHSCNDNNWPDKQLKGLGFSFCTLTSADIYKIEVKTSITTHHQTDREKGRPTEKEGAIFSYESIDPEQEFIGFIFIDDDKDNLIEEIKNVLKDNILLGRSKNAQYGGMAKIEWLGQNQNREIESELPDLTQTNQFIAFLTSDYIGRNDFTGQIDPIWIENELKEHFQNKIEIVRKRWAFGIAGGFNRKWGMPVPQVITLKAGSVLLLEAKNNINKDEFLEIEHQGLGERKAEGFGRLIFIEARPGQLIINCEQKIFVSKPTGSPPPLIKEMQKRILKNAIDREIVNKAVELCKDVKNIPSASLIGRLRHPLRDRVKGLSNLKEIIEGLKGKQAEKSLKNCILSNTKENLMDWLDNQIDKEERALDLTPLAQKNYMTTEEDAEKIIEELSGYIKWRYIEEVLRVLSVKGKTKEEGNNG